MVGAGNALAVEKRQKKTPRKEGGDTRGPKLFGLQAIEELTGIYQSVEFLARLILRKI